MHQVVTGMKFTKQNRVVMLQIQQGRTMPQGQVDSATQQWVPPRHVNTTNQVMDKLQLNSGLLVLESFSMHNRGINIDIVFRWSHNLI